MTWHQLAAMSFGDHAVRHRVATGRLYRAHLAVYAVGDPRLSARGRWNAAILASGDGALLSHRAAAALWEIAPTAGGWVDVTTTRRRRSKPGIRLHCVRRLHPDDRAQVDGIPVTSLARTLLDLAEVISADRLARAFETADRLRLMDMRALDALCARSRGRHGLKPLRAVIAEYAPTVAETRSELERRFLAACRDAGLPRPLVNTIVEGHEVDAFWPDCGLVVELDSFAFHGTRAAFERDRARDAALHLAGHRVVRVTARMLDRDPGRTMTTIRSLLSPARATTPT